MASSADRISALPEEALLHVLSFLPAHEAVRTSVLARRWCHLWKSAPRLHIVQEDRFDTIEEMNKFVNRLLLLRDHSSALEECQFDVGSYSEDDCKHVDLWLRQVMCCQVRSLQLCSLYELSVLGDSPLISQHLRKLYLDSVRLKGCFLDLSSCPVLENLRMVSCSLDNNKLCSKSLKWLNITHSDFELSTHARIYVPSLVSLEIADLDDGLSPLLEGMPSLVTAFIRIGKGCEDYNILDDDDPPVILKGLSDATNLELTVEVDETFAPLRCTLIRDSRWCLTFNNLKTLLLNEWCLAANINILIFFLMDSTILEKLTLQLCKNAKFVLEEGRCIPREQCFASKHLKTVEVKCYEIDELVHEVLNVLSSCGVSLDQINVQQCKSSSSCFSFEQKE